MRVAAEVKSELLNTVGSENLRGIMVILYGSNDMVEYDSGICPLRAAGLASSKAELESAGRRQVVDIWDSLLKDGAITFDGEWDSYAGSGIPVVGGKPSDYLVARLMKPSALADAIIRLTTTPDRSRFR